MLDAMGNLSEGLTLSLGDDRATISSCFRRNRTSKWSWAWDLNGRRKRQKTPLSIWAAVRTISADTKVANVVRIRYYNRGRILTRHKNNGWNKLSLLGGFYQPRSGTPFNR